MSLLFNRKIGLSAYTPNSKTLYLSGNTTSANETLRITFKVTQSDVDTPNAAIIRVYNLKSDTALSLLEGEFQRVTLEAGYDYPNGFAKIFDGTIKQVIFGHESNVDSYAEILAADGDEAYQSYINTVLPASHTKQDELNAVAAAMNVPIGYQPDLPVTAAGREKILYGMSRDQMRNFCVSTGTTWSIQNGQLVLIPIFDYRENVDVVVLNSTKQNTGLIGFPQQTPGGINVTCLLNPRIQIGCLVQILPEDINQNFITTSGTALYGSGTLPALLPKNIAQISGAGFYKVLVVEYEGDTRGDPWYANLVCLAVDKSAPVGARVKAYNANSQQAVGTVTRGEPQFSN